MVQMSKKKPANLVRQGDVFLTFVAEATTLGNELTARRAFDAQVGQYLAERGLTEDFEKWRAGQAQ